MCALARGLQPSPPGVATHELVMSDHRSCRSVIGAIAQQDSVAVLAGVLRDATPKFIVTFIHGCLHSRLDSFTGGHHA
jgi:hypothetical protein